MTSVVIAAHNEAAVIGANLDLLLAGTTPGELEVIVVANGCTDDTAAVARTRPVVVLDLPSPGKVGALNAGDAAATRFPRVYLDADVGVTVATIRALTDALTGTKGAGALVAVPDRQLVLAGRPLAVRCYYAIQTRLPAARTGLYGRGLIAISERGRARFGQFPDVLADDLFLDALFTAEERVIVNSVSTIVEAPLRTWDLVGRLTRVRRGNSALRSAPLTGGRVRKSSRTSWIRHVVVQRPWLAPAGIVYAAITLVAEFRARHGGNSWGTDNSTRTTRIARGFR